MVRLANASKGRYLLVHNLPYSCNISNIQTMFKGCKFMDYSLDNSMETCVLRSAIPARSGKSV